VLEIKVNLEGKRAVVMVSGELGENGAEEFKGQLTPLLTKQLSEVVIDMNGVDYMGSSAIGKILLFYKNFAVSGGSLQVINLAAHLLELFTELKLNTLFSISGR